VVRVELGGVPETLLWTLYHRAVEARRADAVLHDPLAVEVVDALDYPFAERFGDGGAAGVFGQWQALRAGTFDDEVRRFMGAHPGGTVVALGEGLETHFWRVDDGAVRWLGVDLPETVALRAAVVPRVSRVASVAASALDVEAWAGRVDARGPVLITAQGLLMYLTRAEVHGLIGALAARFPGSWLVFDAVPSWMARRTPARHDGAYVAPPWHWALDAREEAALRTLPGVASLASVRVRRGRGVVQGVVVPAISRAGAIRRRLLSIWRAALA
jgi:O-methyltransferase involved in polyketide biosynthesis